MFQTPQTTESQIPTARSVTVRNYSSKLSHPIKKHPE
jgi:hypothetical protein